MNNKISDVLNGYRSIKTVMIEISIAKTYGLIK